MMILDPNEMAPVRRVNLARGLRHFSDEQKQMLPHLARHLTARLATELGKGEAKMPDGPAIFETIGAWEDFSTPSRDLRLLIAIDVVRGFPDRVARRPERYAMPAGKSAATVKAELQNVHSTFLKLEKHATRTGRSTSKPPKQ